MFRVRYHAGQNVNELAIILAMVVLIAVGSFFTLGPEVQRLLTGSSSEIKSMPPNPQQPGGVGEVLKGPVSPQGQGAGGPGGNGSSEQETGTLPSNYANLPQIKLNIIVDPLTQMATISDAAGVPGGSNTTSELGAGDSFISQVKTGQESNVAKTLKIAATLRGLSNSEPDVAAKAFFQQLSQLSYYMGGVEGELDDVAGLDISAKGNPQAKDYTNGDALRDLISYNSQLSQSLQVPPDGLDPQKKAIALALGREVYQLAQKYQFANKEFIDPASMTVTSNWANDDDCELKNTCELNGYPGKSLKAKKNKKYNKTEPVQGWQYDQLMSFDALVKASDAFLLSQAQSSLGIQMVLFKIAALEKDTPHPQMVDGMSIAKPGHH